jgi:hypothetical protein
MNFLHQLWSILLGKPALRLCPVPAHRRHPIVPRPARLPGVCGAPRAAQVSKPAGSPASKSAGQGKPFGGGKHRESAGPESCNPSGLGVCAAPSSAARKTLLVLTGASLGILLGGSPAPAVTKVVPLAQPKPAQISPGAPGTPRPKAQPGQHTSTPAAPVASSASPVPPEEDIRDIRQPRPIPTPWPWVAVVAGVLTLAGAAFAAWKWLARCRQLPLLPYEIALHKLEEARRYMTPEQGREFCFAVSEITRRYIEDRFLLRAARHTTEEFLHDLLDSKEALLASHRVLLADFLQHCDLAKFAQWQFSVPQMEAMHSSARTFVLHSAIDPAAAPSGGHGERSLPKSGRVRLDAPVVTPPVGPPHLAHDAPVAHEAA